MNHFSYSCISKTFVIGHVGLTFFFIFNFSMILLVNAPWNIENLGFCYPITFYLQVVWFIYKYCLQFLTYFLPNIAFRDICPLRALWNGSSLPVSGNLRGEISFHKELRRSMDQYGTFFFFLSYINFKKHSWVTFLGKMKHFPFLTHWR
jgi:hypothetical protein